MPYIRRWGFAWRIYRDVDFLFGVVVWGSGNSDVSGFARLRHSHIQCVPYVYA